MPTGPGKMETICIKEGQSSSGLNKHKCKFKKVEELGGLIWQESVLLVECKMKWKTQNVEF